MLIGRNVKEKKRHTNYAKCTQFHTILTNYLHILYGCSTQSRTRTCISLLGDLCCYLCAWYFWARTSHRSRTRLKAPKLRLTHIVKETPTIHSSQVMFFRDFPKVLCFGLSRSCGLWSHWPLEGVCTQPQQIWAIPCEVPALGTTDSSQDMCQDAAGCRLPAPVWRVD